MILLLDIGNTSIKIALYNQIKNKFIKNFSLLTHSKKSISSIVSFAKKNDVKHVLATSVVPKIYAVLKSKIQNNKVKLYEYKDKIIKKSIKINLKKKSQVGSDRLVNAFASLNLYKKNCIVIDFGTTTTFDIADMNNIYQGGIIAPGINLSLQSLNKFTAKLPLIDISKQKNVIGKDTKSAINSGVFIGYGCLINGIIKKIMTQSKKKYLVVLTGGYSKLFNKSITFKTIINKDITLYGLAMTVKQNKKVFSEI